MIDAHRKVSRIQETVSLFIIFSLPSDLFVFPGIHDKHGRAETQGLVLQEAQAMELPVIVSDVGGMKYGMINDITGFVVEEKNIAGFVDKIELLIADKELRKEMGKQGRMVLKLIIYKRSSQKLTTHGFMHSVIR